MAYFDVLKQPNNTTPDCIGSRSINLMCAVLNTTDSSGTAVRIDYEALYNKAFHVRGGNSTLDNIIRNIEKMDSVLWHGATDTSQIVWDKLVDPAAPGALILIRDHLAASGYPDVKLGDMFKVNYSVLPSAGLVSHYQFIHTALEGVHAVKDDQMFHFCAPLLAVQNGYRLPIDEGVYKKFIGDFGAFTMQDLFQKKLSDPDHATTKLLAKQARANGLLWEGRPIKSRPPSPMRSREGNGKKCVGNVCTEDPQHPEYWCSQVPDGNGGYVCAMGSD